MERFRTMIRAAGLAAAFALGTGCVHVHTDADGRVKSVEVRTSDPKSTAADKPKTDPAVKQAAATVPAAVTALPLKAISKLTGKGDQAKGAPIAIAVAWQPRPAQLPDPVSNGKMMTGLVGQMFLFGPDDQPALANGKLVVEMFDETPGPAATAEPQRLGGWTFEKNALRRLTTMDERFGKCYALFLPWPDYTPATTRVKLTTRFDPEKGYPIFALPYSMTLDTRTNGTTNGPAAPAAPPLMIGTGPTGSAPAAGFMGVPAGPQPPPNVMPPLNPLPIGGGSATGQPAANAPALPPGLAPIAFTVPPRR